MTLCVVWKKQDNIHFASDSRIKVQNNSYADVAIKVLSVPYKIFGPTDGNTGVKTLDYQGEIGMCFAGSAINSFFIKESLAEIMKELQHAPGFIDVSMEGISNFMFTAYKLISNKICQTALGEKGRSAIAIAGFCNHQKRLRAFLFETNIHNQYSCKEILKEDGDYEFFGSGKERASQIHQTLGKNSDYFSVLKTVIDDPNTEDVGGSIQSGEFVKPEYKIFQTYGIETYEESVGYWRGALDLHSPEFQKDGLLMTTYTYQNPFDVFNAKK